MADTTFVDNKTIIQAAWLNDLNLLNYTTYPAHIIDYDANVVIYNAHIANTSNPHSVTKTQVGLGNVTDDAQLTIANNLSDVAVVATARTNLSVYSQAEVDTAIDGVVPRTSTTGSAELPSGTTAQRDGTPSAGYLRYNSDFGRFEGYSTAWAGLGGATGAGGDDIFYENGQTVTADYTLTTGKNAMSAGDITIATGVTVTVPAGATWTVV